MNRAINELLRLKTPLILIISWIIIWGIKDSLMTISLLTGFIAVSIILGHIVAKEIFRKYDWDVGKKLNEAWESSFNTKYSGLDNIARAMLSTGMLIARVLIYIAIMISMAFLSSFLLKGSAFGFTIQSESRPHLPILKILKEEHQRIWPESDIAILAGQIEAESRWKETARRIEPNGRTSYGLMQVLDTTFIEMRKKHSILSDIEPVQMLQARYGIRAGILYDLQMWNLIQCRQDELMHYYYMLRAYNGGIVLLNKEISKARTCDPISVAKQCKRKVIGKLDLCKVNLDYPVRVFRYAKKYRGYFDD